MKLLLLLGIFFTVAGCDGCDKDKQKGKIEVIFKELAEKEKYFWDEITANDPSAASEVKKVFQAMDKEFKKLDNKKARKNAIIELQTVIPALILRLRVHLTSHPEVNLQQANKVIAKLQEICDLKLKYYKQAAEVE